ncbi:metallophosphoesterase [Clostridium folliculivorans]|uniref:Serine/threonine protein phosphatase n=1 Tax=Clostridium folliculivorans TaxID=2886038 RepID=A0A9W5XZA2_9CLOT|nr:metallophosphoesterase [Clostridium folliculivorans]GKU23693.1 serine/threonine protein phosphatase [Clostridium folliculivorans]GKU29809.1 serine/threonine protein phosphatase [Clostridium folliculivorans]
MRISKIYKAVISISFMLVLVGCSSSSIKLKEDYKIKSGHDINFYVTTDLHYLSKSLTDNGEAFSKFVSSGDGKDLQYIDAITEAFTSNVKAKKPNVLIISGDLTTNGEKQSHLDLAKKLKTIEENGTSVYVIPGNHDILNPYARGFKDDKQFVTDNISDKDFSKIYADFGYSEAISKDEGTLSYLATPTEDVWLLMLDTNKYKSNISLGAPQLGGELSQKTLDWIKKCSDFAKEKGAHIITVMHHNILDHSEVVRKGFTLDNNEEALKIFKENKLDLVLSGHIHIQDIASDNKDNPELYDIATNSLAAYPHQYGMLKYSSKDKSFTYSTAKVDVDGWSKSNGIKDKNLNNFAKYSEDYFGKFGYDMISKRLELQESYSDNDLKLMSETMKTLNLRYFAGTENLNSKDVIGSEGFKLLSNLPDSFFRNYAMNIARDKGTDNNNLYFKIHNEVSKTEK